MHLLGCAIGFQDSNPIFVGEGCGAVAGMNAVAFQQLRDAACQLLHDRCLVCEDLRVINCRVARLYPAFGGILDLRGERGDRKEGFRWNASAMEARAAPVPFLDEAHRGTQLCGFNGGDITPRSAADNSNVIRGHSCSYLV